ncbi:MAG: acetolactate synthase I/II/III large subunit [Roseibaca calidilacus]|uniref:Acetolactate synthase I/II/III large subunit n=1 Tax=Roseibaca calidilacus TaxID=1666912 RepID=A0A0P7YV50_9RHOB|nr:thiamine pyrophosphate-binding protein [Roseibaca calidilacus]KPP94499.1 MAG: acetolactate synthase I/II/III large subunit [Roseibaca calidilacus]CUX83130.1 acetolactate synthase-1/2/3 large subunit [Roseibaca calidilacus]
MTLRHGGQILVDQLKAQGVRRVFSVPGESFLAALDGLHESGIENIVCRHEGGAVMMAEAHAKLTGQPGVAFVTRGPGATNGSSGIHVAKQDSTPLILFVGQIDTRHRDREAFQEVDYRAVFGPLAKWAAEVDQTDRLPEYISRAFHVAQSGRPGPVVLALPENMLSARADVPDLPPVAPMPPSVCGEQIDAVLDMLCRAERPLVIAGGSVWSSQAAQDLARFAEGFGLPVCATFRRMDRIDNRHPNYAGDLSVGMNPKLGQRLRDADCLLVIGARLGDIATGSYQHVDPAAPGKAIIHIHPDPDELGRVFRPDLGLVAPAVDVLARLARRDAPARPDWSAWTKSARADYLDWITPRETPGDVKLEQVLSRLSDLLPDDAIVTNGAGNFAAFLHRYFRARAFPGNLAPTSGSMGYGFPASIAAKLEHPDRAVVCVAGDGDFQMTLNELSTARQYGANVVVIVCNNGQYGTIRMHQEKTYPGRVSGTQLFNPDYAALVQAYGGHGECVRATEEFAPALDRALNAGVPAVIELVLDPDALSPGLTIEGARALAKA